TGLSHPLCTECTELLFELMTRELDALKKERDRLLGFEKDVHKRRDEVLKQLKVANPAAAGGKGPGAGELELKEALDKDIAKLRKAEAHAVAELKAVEAQKSSLAADKAALDAEEAELAREEAEFWKQHSKYVVRRDELQDREDSLRTRLAYGHKELEKLQRTNVYNDAFCIGQEAGFGTINGLRLGRLPGINVEWPEINAAWGHTLLLLSTIAHKFGFHHFGGYRLVPCGSFSTIEKLEEDPANAEADTPTATTVSYGSGDFAVTRLLQNRRFDMAMVAFLECLRQLVEFVTARDPKVRVPHAVVKDRIGDVSIKLQFGSDEAWTRALRHV
ncbi:autophagy protein 6, partial [Rhodotorula sp. JG-1b]